VATLISFPVILLLAILQSSVISRIVLLHGSADIILLALVAWSLQEHVKDAWLWAVLGGLAIGALSGLPLILTLVAYGLVVAGVRWMRRRIWQVPILAMFVGTILGTFLVLGFQYIYRMVGGVALSIGDSLSLVILPSILINLLFSIPMYTILTDLAGWMYPANKEKE